MCANRLREVMTIACKAHKREGGDVEPLSPCIDDSGIIYPRFACVVPFRPIPRNGDSVPGRSITLAFVSHLFLSHIAGLVQYSSNSESSRIGKRLDNFMTK